MGHLLPTTIGNILFIAIFVISNIVNILYFKKHRKKAKALERFIARTWLIFIGALILLLISAFSYKMF